MHAEWLIEGRVCQVIVPPDLNQDILKAFDTSMVGLLESSQGQVYVIVDVSHMDAVPSALNWLSLKMIRHPRLAFALTVGLERKPMVRFIVSFISQLVGRPFKDFATQDEALAYLHQMKYV